jgi:cytochrome b subunit of formate dehydrogenase
LGVTSFVAMIRFGALGGWWLFIHMFGAGAFTVALPVLALTWCQANRFGCSAQPACDEGQAPTSRFPCLAKAMFWVILAAGLVVTGTMLLSMLPLFGTQGLELLLDVHRYAGLAVVAAMILHLYAALLPRFGLS